MPSDSSLTGRVIIVVGASSGMGQASARRLAREGASVVAAARRRERLEELQRELETEGIAIGVAEIDATRPADVERLVQDTLKQHARIDALVYATGTNVPERSLEQISVENWELLLATNLTGAFLCTKAVLPAMRRQGDGLIVYLSTGAVQAADVSGVAYQASKHGLSGLAGGTRAEEKKRGIRTTVVFPGLCDTEILLKRPVPTPREVVEKALRPEDVAEAVAFVCRLDPRCHVPELQLFAARV
jgi:serine 3-dehydrogenase (NADP+)